MTLFSGDMMLLISDNLFSASFFHSCLLNKGSRGK